MADKTGKDLDLAKDLSSMLMGRDEFRNSLPAQASGRKALLVASLDDPLRTLLERVADVGLPATVCVRRAKNSISTIGLDISTASDAEIFVPRPDATVGVLVALLWEKRTLHLRVDGCETPHANEVDFELV